MPHLPRILALLLLTAPLLVNAAPAPADKDTSYDIEVLVFENHLPDLVGDELLQKDAASVKLRGQEKAGTVENIAGESFFVPDVIARMEQDGHYRMLAQAHWNQTLDPNDRETMRPVKITSVHPGELEGNIRFYMSRYLHLDVNLAYRDTSTSSPALFIMSEQRRIKAQEIQYFDHPRFGVLVRVTPLGKDGKSP